MPHFLEKLERLGRLLLIHLMDGEAGVDEHVLAHARVIEELQPDLTDGAADLDPSDLAVYLD